MRFIIESLSKYKSNAISRKWNDNILNSTGPTFLTEVTELYLKNNITDDLLITPSDWLVSTLDAVNVDRFKVECKLRRASLRKRSASEMKDCKDLNNFVYANQPNNLSYTIHHWLHSWATNFVAKGYIKAEAFLKRTTFYVWSVQL